MSATAGSPGELLSRRCVTLFKAALKPDVWPNTELKLTWLVKDNYIYCMYQSVTSTVIIIMYNVDAAVAYISHFVFGHI